MTKITDLEADLGQFKADSTDRFDRLEKAIEALQADAAKRQADADKRHSEIMALLLAQAKATPPPLPTAPLTLSAAPSSIAGPPPAATHPQSLPLVTLPLSTPPFLGHDSFGQRFHPHTSADGATSYIHPSQPFTQSVPPNLDIPSVTFTDHGPFMGDNGFGRGPRPPGDRMWLAGPDYRLRKLKMPLFDGTDAFGWVYRLERYFDIQGFVTTGERLRAAVLCMEGQALAWYRWAEGRSPFRHWEELKARLLERFQPSHEGDIYEQFLAIEQEGSVREYIGAFETLAAQLVTVPEKVMAGTFIKGLKPEIRSSVRMLQPIGLTNMIKTALLSEEGRSTNIGDHARGVAGVAPPPPRLGSTGPKPVMETTGPVLKRMTEAEILERRAKGLCFKCNGRFGPGHRCPDKALQVLVIDNDEKTSAGDEELGGKHHAE